MDEVLDVGRLLSSALRTKLLWDHSGSVHPQNWVTIGTLPIVENRAKQGIAAGHLVSHSFLTKHRDTKANLDKYDAQSYN